MHVLMCYRTLCYRPIYAIAFYLLHHPGLSPAHTPLPSTVSRATLILPGTSKASTAPLLIVHEDPNNTGGCDHVVPGIQAESTQAKLHTCMHRICTILRYISTCASDCAVTSGPTYVEPCTRVQYAPRLCIFPVLLLLVLMVIHFY